MDPSIRIRIRNGRGMAGRRRPVQSIERIFELAGIPAHLGKIPCKGASPLSWRLGASLLIAWFVMLAGPVGALDSEGDSPDYARPGWYVGLGGFMAISNISLTTTDLGVPSPVPYPPGTDPDFGNSGGIDVRFGYRAFSRWAFELDYQWQSGFNSSNSAISPDLEIDTHLLSLNTKLFVLTDRWQPYALLGASLLIFNTEIVDESFPKPWSIDYGYATRFGAGLDYYINERWLLTLEGTYVLAVGGLDGADMGTVGIGAQYRF